jgi:HEAT repeat protein
MATSFGSNLEDLEYDLWEKMKERNLDELHVALSSSDELYRYAAARELQLRGDSTTFDFAVGLLKNANPILREVAAFTLGQLGEPARPFLDETVPRLVTLLQSDIDSRVRSEAAAALGHLGSRDSFECLRQASFDGDVGIRVSVAFALGKILHNEESIQPLLSLTKDVDDEVVCMAIEGLRFLDINSLLVRNRLVEMLSSVHGEILDEVVCALAGWQDSRVLPWLLDALHRDEINYDFLEAAGNLGDEKALPRLNELLDQWGNDPPKILLNAISKLS